MLINRNSQFKTYNETQTLYKLCGFDDMNGNGIIEEPSISNGWKTKEGYKEEADINRDGKIIAAEAKYYLWSLANIRTETKKEFPLSMDDQKSIRDLFVDVYDRACGRSGVNEKVRFALYFGSLEAEMNLRRDNIGDEGCKPLAEVLKVNKSIKNLFLGINNIGDIGAQFLSEALKINRTLTDLDLWSNNIGAKGAKSLSEALKINDTLAELNIWGNNIGDEGAKALAEAIKVNKGLTRIDLGTNNISDEGARALAEAIKVNKSVTVLYLYGNKISDEGQGFLAKAVVARQAQGKPVRIIVTDYPGTRPNN
jgi:Ran GTPase-activating protein (RanGAP) involved in mRNA processing and transport